MIKFQELPATLIEISLDNTDSTPQQAAGFLRRRAGGPLKLIHMGCVAGKSGEWGRVREVATSLDIAFQAQGNSWQIPTPLEMIFHQWRR